MSAVQQKLLDIFFYDMEELSISTFYRPKKPMDAQIVMEQPKVAKAAPRKGKKKAGGK